MDDQIVLVQRMDLTPYLDISSSQRRRVFGLGGPRTGETNKDGPGNMEQRRVLTSEPEIFRSNYNLTST